MAPGGRMKYILDKIKEISISTTKMRKVNLTQL